MASILKRKISPRVIIYLALILILFISGFLYLKSRSLTKTVLKKTFAKNIQFSETVSLEKADQKDQYQPTLQLKFTKPTGQKSAQNLRFTLNIPKEFAQSTDQLSFSIAPAQILQKDPIVVWGFDEPLGDKICDIYVEPSEGVQTEDGMVCFNISKVEVDKREIFGDWLTLEEREKYSRLNPSEREKRMAELIDTFNKNYPEIETKYSEKIVQQYKAELEKFKQEIIDWLSGQINSLIITVKREPMDYQSGRKVCTKTIQILAKQKPPEASEAKVSPEVREEKVYLSDKLLVDIASEAGGCHGFGTNFIYSPKKDYFLVDLGCFEGDDHAFLFKADGSDKRKITGEWDYVNEGQVSWDSDGKSFVYDHINSCCAEPPAGVMPPGKVRYNIESGQKTWLEPLPTNPYTQ